MSLSLYQALYSIEKQEQLAPKIIAILDKAKKVLNNWLYTDGDNFISTVGIVASDIFRMQRAIITLAESEKINLEEYAGDSLSILSVDIEDISPELSDAVAFYARTLKRCTEAMEHQPEPAQSYFTTFNDEYSYEQLMTILSNPIIPRELAVNIQKVTDAFIILDACTITIQLMIEQKEELIHIDKKSEIVAFTIGEFTQMFGGIFKSLNSSNKRKKDITKEVDITDDDISFNNKLSEAGISGYAKSLIDGD